MVFIETPVFTHAVRALLTDDEYSELQLFLAQTPLAGDVIQHSGGMRKVRWKQTGKGKRGGVRVIYYHVALDEQIRMLLIYPKTAQDNLTAEQLKRLKTLVERW